MSEPVVIALIGAGGVVMAAVVTAILTRSRHQPVNPHAPTTDSKAEAAKASVQGEGKQPPTHLPVASIPTLSKPPIRQENPMALRKCPEPDCGKMVSTMAEMCPHCGCPLKAAGGPDLGAVGEPDIDELDGFTATQTTGQRPTVRLKLPADQALALIRQIPHSKCQRAIPNNWKLDRSGQVTRESVDWLYCWAKTGMNSERAAEFSRRVFNAIFDMSFAGYDAQVDHEESRRNRYR